VTEERLEPEGREKKMGWTQEVKPHRSKRNIEEGEKRACAVSGLQKGEKRSGTRNLEQNPERTLEEKEIHRRGGVYHSDHLIKDGRGRSRKHQNEKR